VTRHNACRHIAIAAILVLAACSVVAEEYLGRDEFLGLAFGDSPPEMQTLWLTRETKEAATDAVGWTPAALRLRYWQHGRRTAWILEDIGKEKPITLGIAVAAGQIERVDVLAFRESRGWEIRYPFFTDQFSGVTLAQDGYLSEPIDGITGATLSVQALTRLAGVALFLDENVGCVSGA